MCVCVCPRGPWHVPVALFLVSLGPPSLLTTHLHHPHPPPPTQPTHTRQKPHHTPACVSTRALACPAVAAGLAPCPQGTSTTPLLTHLHTTTSTTLQATFYGAGGAGEIGACMLARGFNDVGLTVAINGPMWNNAQNCGKCVKVRTTSFLSSPPFLFPVSHPPTHPTSTPINTTVGRHRVRHRHHPGVRPHLRHRGQRLPGVQGR